MPHGNGRGGGSGSGGGKGGGKGSAGGGGGSRAGSSGPTEPRWDCTICGRTGNFASRTRCRACDAYRRKDGGGHVASRSPSAGGSGGGQTFAERQLQRERDEQKLLKEKRKLQDEAKRLREENRKMEAELEAARATTRNGADAGDSDCEMEASEGDYSSWSEEDRQRRLELARAGLAYASEVHGESSAEASRIREEVEGLQRASREAKPFRAHRAQLERRRDRLRRQQERDEGEVEKIRAEVETLRAKETELQATIAERSKALGQVERELTDLVKRSLAEDAAGDGDEDGWSAAAASAAIKAIADKPGVPAEFAALLAQVQIAAAAIARNTAGSSAQKPSPTPPAPSQPPTPHPPPPQQPSQPPPASNSGGTAAQPTAGAGLAAAGPPAVLAPLGGDARPAVGSVAGAAPATPGVEAAHAGPSKENKSEESGDELQEDDGPRDMEVVERTISNLPKRDQRWIRAAIAARGGGGVRSRKDGDGEGNEGDEEGNHRRTRERSPRPRGGNGADAEL